MLHARGCVRTWARTSVCCGHCFLESDLDRCQFHIFVNTSLHNTGCTHMHTHTARDRIPFHRYTSTWHHIPLCVCVCFVFETCSLQQITYNDATIYPWIMNNLQQLKAGKHFAKIPRPFCCFSTVSLYCVHVVLLTTQRIDPRHRTGNIFLQFKTHCLTMK